MNSERKKKKILKIADNYFYNKRNFEKSILNYKKLIQCEKGYREREDIFRKLSKSFLYMSDNLCSKRDFYLQESLKYVNITLKMSCWYLDAHELKLDILKELGNKKEVTEYQKKIKLFKQEIKDTVLDLDSFYGAKK
jgi:hypothetical protein